MTAGMPIGDLISVGAAAWPQRCAIKLRGGRSLTYRELDIRTSRLANALLGGGCVPGDRVAAWMEDSPEYVELYLAAAKAGLVVVPVNARFKAEEARYQLEQSGASVLVFTGGIAERAWELMHVAEVRRAIAVEPPFGGNIASYEFLVANGSSTPPPPPDEDMALLIAYTSGTTGSPKGATITHRSLQNLLRSQISAIRLPLGSVSLHLASMSFPATVTSLLLPHLFVGGTTILMGHWDTEQLIDAISNERASFFYLPTPAIPSFTEEVERTPSILDGVVSILHAGSRADAHALRRLGAAIGPRYLEGWGMTELSGALATATGLRDNLLGPPERFYDSVGTAVPGTVVRVVDDQRNPLPHDGQTTGELAVRSPSVMREYWNRPADTASALVDGWYYTGDIGAIDDNGYVYIADRRADLIVSGGMNVYPAELEAVINQMDAVIESAVVALPHPRWGQSPAAVVIVKQGAVLSEADVVQWCADRLANYKKPQRVFFADSLPRNANGKIQRHQVRSLAERLSQTQSVVT